jgi:hypothetical protein
LPYLGIYEKRAVDPTHIEIAAFQGFDLVAQAPRSVPIVVVPVNDDVALGNFTRKVSFGAKPQPTWQRYVFDLRMGRDDVLDAVRSVVDDHEFLVGVVLREE